MLYYIRLSNRTVATLKGEMRIDFSQNPTNKQLETLSDWFCFRLAARVQVLLSFAFTVMYQSTPGTSSPITSVPSPHSLGPLQIPDTTSQTSRPDDYVYFERSNSGFSSDAIARATAAKLKLVSYYKMAVDSAIERNTRWFYTCRCATLDWPFIQLGVLS